MAIQAIHKSIQRYRSDKVDNMAIKGKSVQLQMIEPPRSNQNMP